VLRCLAKDRADRFPDAPALAEALTACDAAGEWDAQRAELWWHQHEPDVVTEAEPRAVVGNDHHRARRPAMSLRRRHGRWDRKKIGKPFTGPKVTSL